MGGRGGSGCGAGRTSGRGDGWESAASLVICKDLREPFTLAI